jgi:hypothetical protein
MTNPINILEFMLQKHRKIVHCNNFTYNERFFFMFQRQLLSFFRIFAGKTNKWI